MKKTVSAIVATCFAVGSFAAPALADSVVIKVKPPQPVVKRVVVVRKPCYYKTVKTVSNHKTVIVKKRVCP